LGTFTSVLIPDASLVCWITFKLLDGRPTVLAIAVRQLLLACLNALDETDWARPGAWKAKAANASAVNEMTRGKRIMVFPA
jgi:hypothetical protein